MDNLLTLKTFLTKLAMLCMVPLLLLADYLAICHVRVLQSRFDHDAEHQTRNLSATIDSHIKAQIAALQMAALRLAEERAGCIDLLVTDVVMPDMNGRDLADRLHTLYPNIKILFMSGCTNNVIVHRGGLDDGVNFTPKPFSQKDLTFKVREAFGRDGQGG